MLEPELCSDGTLVTQLLQLVISLSKQLRHMCAAKMFVMLLAEQSCGTFMMQAEVVKHLRNTHEICVISRLST